jgi:AcrR family transcriptional regulator
MTPAAGTKRLRRPERKAQTRRRLTQAAARVFAERGFHAASVEAVAEEAGYSTGAVYSNFSGKEDLFLALWEERIERRRRELREVIQNAGGPKEGLAPASANIMDVLGRERDWFLLYFEFALHAARDPAFARRFERVREQGLADLAAGIAEGLEKAGLESSLDPAELALALKALSYGVGLERLVSEDSVPDELLGRVMELVFRGLRAEAEAWRG